MTQPKQQCRAPRRFSLDVGVTWRLSGGEGELPSDVQVNSAPWTVPGRCPVATAQFCLDSEIPPHVPEAAPCVL